LHQNTKAIRKTNRHSDYNRLFTASTHCSLPRGRASQPSAPSRERLPRHDEGGWRILVQSTGCGRTVVDMVTHFLFVLQVRSKLSFKTSPQWNTMPCSLFPLPWKKRMCHWQTSVPF